MTPRWAQGPQDVAKAHALASHSQTSAATTVRLARAVGGDRCHIFDAADLHARARKCAQSTLSAWARSLRLRAACGSELDVERRKAQLLAPRSDILCGKHCCVRRRFVAVRLDLHAARDARNCLPAREIGYMDKGIIEGSVDVCNSKDHLTLSDLRPEGNLLNWLFLFRRHA